MLGVHFFPFWGSSQKKGTPKIFRQNCVCNSTTSLKNNILVLSNLGEDSVQDLGRQKKEKNLIVAESELVEIKGHM